MTMKFNELPCDYIRLNDGSKAIDLFIAKGWESPWCVMGTVDSGKFKDKVIILFNFKTLEDAEKQFPKISVNHSYKHIF